MQSFLVKSVSGEVNLENPLTNFLYYVHIPMKPLNFVMFYYVVMYFYDIYYVLMMFGKMYTKKWYLIILLPNGMG